MNFIDKYKEDLKNGFVEKKLPEDGITEEDLKKLQEAMANAQIIGMETAEPTQEDREALKKEMLFFSEMCCDCADVFFERFKNKLTYGKIVPLVQSFYEIMLEVMCYGK